MHKACEITETYNLLAEAFPASIVLCCMSFPLSPSNTFLWKMRSPSQGDHKATNWIHTFHFTFLDLDLIQKFMTVGIKSLAYFSNICYI